MLILKIFLLILSTFLANVKSLESRDIPPIGHEYYSVDLLEMGHRLNMAPYLISKFLLEMYDIIENKEGLDYVLEYLAQRSRQERALSDENFITKLDCIEMEECNNIITFSSKNISNSKTQLIPNIPIASDMEIGFNTNDVPCDLKIVYSVLKIYQQPSLGKYAQNTDMQTVTITIYERIMHRKVFNGTLRIINSINTTTNYKGWLEFNITSTLNRWLTQKFIQTVHTNELIVGVNLNMNSSTAAPKQKTVDILASDVGLVKTDLSLEMINLQPFVIGYFKGSDLMAKLQKSRFKRDLIKHKRKADFHIPRFPAISQIYNTSESCDRLNFTLHFKDLHMDHYVIAPKKFEAYFCGGECNFPLGAKVNATNHAIVQTLMHLKNSSIPKPSCVPTVLGSIKVLHSLNEDNYDLQIYPQSVAKECGCR